jgi:hypothetical protein
VSTSRVSCMVAVTKSPSGLGNINLFSCCLILIFQWLELSKMASREVNTRRRERGELPPQRIMNTFSLCQLCASMTAELDNAKQLNSRQGFKYLSRRELALSSRYCTFCFWLWAQLHRTWKPGSPGDLYMFATGRDSIIDVLTRLPGDMPKIRSVSMRQEGWLGRADHIEGRVKFPVGTPRSYRQPNSARF